MKNIYLIVGASGTGKSTIVENLVKHYNAVEVLSYTDRPQRYENEGGHIYVTKEEFDELPPMVAYTNFASHRYGVTQEIFDKSDFYVIDPAGVIYLYKHYKGERPIVVIGLTASSDELKRRLQLRDGNTDRYQHDINIFSDSVMKLICDEIIDVSNSIDKNIEYVKMIIDKYEKE